ncbi:MAG: amylosucrase, partial [Anaerolineae bacterium]|nr:amylosucrase [Anaerolineae bacterium]
MPGENWLTREAARSLDRLLPRVEPLLTDLPEAERRTFVERLRAQFPRLFRLLHGLYGSRYDFFYHLEEVLLAAARCYMARPPDLKALDRQREADPLWFQSEQVVGGVCYVDLFAGSINALYDKIAYFEELGLTYLHLMPLFRCPAENNDGGYAVSSYREVDPALGTMADLAAFAAELRRHGIS